MNPLFFSENTSVVLDVTAGKTNSASVTESQNGRGWKGPLWVI